MMELVGPDMVEKVARLGFPGGGYRVCRKCKKFKRVSLETIIEWPQLKPPPCLICGSRTELMTPEEAERAR